VVPVTLRRVDVSTHSALLCGTASWKTMLAGVTGGYFFVYFAWCSVVSVVFGPFLSGASFHPNTYSLFNPYSKLMKILSGASFHPNTYSLFNSYSKLMKILSGASFHPNTYNPHIYEGLEGAVCLSWSSHIYIYIYIYI
jgi:hypothetical protein